MFSRKEQRKTAPKKQHRITGTPPSSPLRGLLDGLTVLAGLDLDFDGELTVSSEDPVWLCRPPRAPAAPASSSPSELSELSPVNGTERI